MPGERRVKYVSGGSAAALAAAVDRATSRPTSAYIPAENNIMPTQRSTVTKKKGNLTQPNV